MKTNVKTTIWGAILAIVFVVSASPDMVDFLSNTGDTKAVVIGISKLAAAVLLFMGFRAAKDKDVTGAGPDAKRVED